MALPIVERIIASRQTNPEARALALEEAAMELEWMKRGYAAHAMGVLGDGAAAIRSLVNAPTMGPDVAPQTMADAPPDGPIVGQRRPWSSAMVEAVAVVPGRVFVMPCSPAAAGRPFAISAASWAALPEVGSHANPA